MLNNSPGSLAAYHSRLLLRLGEITLKGLNRHHFENQLLKNLRRRLAAEGDFRLQKRDSRVWISLAKEEELTPEARELELAKALQAVKDVFGYVSVSPVREFSCDLAVMETQVLDLAHKLFADGKAHTFKMEIRRINKQFPLNSYELACHMGDLILDNSPAPLSRK